MRRNRPSHLPVFSLGKDNMGSVDRQLLEACCFCGTRGSFAQVWRKRRSEEAGAGGDNDAALHGALSRTSRRAQLYTLIALNLRPDTSRWAPQLSHCTAEETKILWGRVPCFRWHRELCLILEPVFLTTTLFWQALEM